MLNYTSRLYQLGALPVILPGATECVNIGAASAASSTMGGATLVRLVATVDCLVAIGENPVAAANSMFLPANTPEYFACNPNEKVAVLRAVADGVLYVTAAREEPR